MYQFDYQRPANLTAAVAALRDQDGMGKLLAGGQTLIPALKQRLNQPSMLIDLAGIAELSGIRQTSGKLTIGAMTAHAEVASDDTTRSSIPALARLAGGIGDPQVRHSGTIGGSLANNDPAADYPSAVLALDATVVTDRRRIPAGDFFQGFFTTALEPDEIITAVEFPIPLDAGPLDAGPLTAGPLTAGPLTAGYGRWEQRASRYPLVGVFVARTASGVRVAVTGAGKDGVFRCAELETALSADWSPDTAKKTTVPADTLMGDLHGSAEYRAALISVMAARAIEAAA